MENLAKALASFGTISQQMADALNNYIEILKKSA